MTDEARQLLRECMSGYTYVRAEDVVTAAELIKEGYAAAENDYDDIRIYATEEGRKYLTEWDSYQPAPLARELVTELNDGDGG